MDSTNFDKDINVDDNSLSSTISKLQSDNERISEIVKKIYDDINYLNDDEIWKSPEKEEIMSELMPYLDDTKTSLYTDLSNCLGTLNVALDSYMQDDEALKKGAQEIAEIVEE